jgi:hypothetical protein
VYSETRVRFTLPVVVAVLLLGGGSVAPAQDVTADDLLDPEIAQDERICDLEIAKVEATLDEHVQSFDQMEQSRLRTQLREAQDLCDDGNEVVAAIRLEAVTAVIEVTGVAD